MYEWKLNCEGLFLPVKDNPSLCSYTFQCKTGKLKKKCSQLNRRFERKVDEKEQSGMNGLRDKVRIWIKNLYLPSLLVVDLCPAVVWKKKGHT